MIDSENRSHPVDGVGKNAAERRFVSIVTPACNEAQNLPEMYQRLKTVLDAADVKWEWIVVDDHSSDETFKVLSGLAAMDDRLRAFRFSRNFGSHTAIACGLHNARGDCAVVMASDLQDPPEEIPNLLEERQKGAHVVWAVRRRRTGEGFTTTGFSRIYWSLMRRIGAIENLPATGADFVLLDRRVIDAINRFQETNANIVSLISWMGFPTAYIEYDKKARLRGESSWNIKKKLKLAVDTLTSFTYFPIRAMSYVGFITAIFGFLYAMFIVFVAFLGHPVEGWASLMAVVLVLGGIQMTMLGVLGEYLWRALDESRRRPRYIIEAEIGPETKREEEKINDRLRP